MKKKFKIVIIPTEKASPLFSYKERPDLLYYQPLREWTSIVNHLNILIISDEEIKKGDFCYSERDGWVRQCENPMPELEKAVGAKKIVATTDTGLRHLLGVNHGGCASIPEEFIKYFIKSNNDKKIITEVELEMEFLKEPIFTDEDVHLKAMLFDQWLKIKDIPFVKINSSNEVIISEIN